MPHTYQVRDFAPKLAAALGRSLISDAVGYKYEGGKLLFTRQMFQGKFAADVSFVGEAPYFATFQNGAFRGDQVQEGNAAAPVRRSRWKSPTAWFEISRKPHSKRPSRQWI